jgi:hypothetical protein
VKFLAWAIGLVAVGVVLGLAVAGVTHWRNEANVPASANVASNERACTAFVNFWDHLGSNQNGTTSTATNAELANVLKWGEKAESPAIQVAVQDWMPFDLSTPDQPQENVGFAEYAQACDSLKLGPSAQ